MKKKLLYIIVLILTGIINHAFVYGQNSSVLSKLQGKTWRSQNLSGYDLYLKEKYDCCTVTTTNTVEGKDGSDNMEKRFYLSDKIDTQFDESKVGKVQNGKYIIRKGDEIFQIAVYVDEIIKLDDKEFIMKSDAGRILNFRAVEFFNMKNIVSQVPAEKHVFNIEKKDTIVFIGGCPWVPLRGAAYHKDLKSAKYKIEKIKEYKTLYIIELSRNDSIYCLLTEAKINPPRLLLQNNRLLFDDSLEKCETSIVEAGNFYDLQLDAFTDIKLGVAPPNLHKRSFYHGFDDYEFSVEFNGTKLPIKDKPYTTKNLKGLCIVKED